MTPQINPKKDMLYSLFDCRFDCVLYVYHSDWLGVRSAVGSLPGHKLLIHHEFFVKEDFFIVLCDFIEKNNICKICFHAYSYSADDLLKRLFFKYYSSIDFFCVMHSPLSQAFGCPYTSRIFSLVYENKKNNIFHKVCSVKPLVYKVLDFFDPICLYNAAPNILNIEINKELACFIPLALEERKNFYMNVISAIKTNIFEKIYIVNYSDIIINYNFISKSKVFHTGTLGDEKWIYFGKSLLSLNVTFAEAQPMVMLESLACGTPCLIPELSIPVLDTHELSKLLSVKNMQPSDSIINSIISITKYLNSDKIYLDSLIYDYCKQTRALAIESYGNMFNL